MSTTITDFTQLTSQGKLRRIRKLAENALKEYDIEVEQWGMLAFATNLLYKVRSKTGQRFVLRMAYPGWRSLEDLRAEAAWLKALHTGTEIGAPLVIPSSKGEDVLPMRGAGVPDTWHATLMTWVEGILLAHRLTCANLERMGSLFAQLHLHGQSWRPPSGFTTKQFDAFLSRGEPDMIFGEGLIQSFREEDQKAYLRAKQWVENEYDRLPQSDLRVIHCDLWHENIKLDHGKLRPFDFEDTIWGYRLHDIAMGMLDLLETVGPCRYEELFASFRAGYESHLEWPQGNLEVLQIGRLLWISNYVARFERESLNPLSEKHGKIFRSFEQTGKLRLSK